MPADPPGFFPPANVIPPLSLPHKQTMILLHGRGFSSSTFGPDLISTSFPLPPSPSLSPDPILSPAPAPAPAKEEEEEVKKEGEEGGEEEEEEERAALGSLRTLRTLYPHAKFLLPTAPRHRATIYARSLVRQWFDGWHLYARDDDDGDEEEEEEWRCIPGLRDTVAHVHELVRAEAALVGGTRNVVLGGLSQGCAAGLAALLLWDGEEPLAGFLGMCGWLVFERALRRAMSEGEGDGGEEGEDDGFDPFEREEEEENEDGGGMGEKQEEVSVEAKVVRALRETLELDDGKGPTCRPRAFDTPVFLGHGLDDDKVPISRGRGSAKFLKAAGMHVEWKEYHGLGHWYSPAMLSDMVSFLAHQTDWDRDRKPS